MIVYKGFVDLGKEIKASRMLRVCEGRDPYEADEGECKTWGFMPWEESIGVAHEYPVSKDTLHGRCVMV